MKIVKFTQSEMEFLRERYNEEIANAQNYIDQLKGIMKKMGIDHKIPETQDLDPVVVQRSKKRGRKPIFFVETVEPTEPKKRGRKPKIVVEAVIPREPKKRGRKPKTPVETVVPSEPKKRGRKPKTFSETEIPAYSLDKSTPKRKKRKVSQYRKSGGTMLNLPPMAKQKNIKDLILEKFPEMIGKINKT